jgi:peptidyl-prolyl cis-trans isomerase B (cyclophilin B)
VATKKERQRQLAKDALERKLQRQAQRDRRAKVLAVGVISAVLVVGVAVGSLVAAGVLFSSAKASKPSAHASATPSVAPSATPSVAASATPSASASPLTAMVGGKCVYNASGTAARKVSFPPAKPDTKATYQATIATNRGTIVIDLLNSKAPCTVNSFVSLADQKYFSSTPCQRLTTAAYGIYVLQCGDPTGTGSGGPGYEFYTENLAGAKYPAGTVAMARGLSSQDTNGSQFFLVYQNTPLPPGYTPFGTIVSGLNIIQNVAKAGSDNSNGAGDGHPKEKVEIESVTIKKT